MSGAYGPERVPDWRTDVMRQHREAIELETIEGTAINRSGVVFIMREDAEPEITESNAGGHAE